jgi:hypothetical protein
MDPQVAAERPQRQDATMPDSRRAIVKPVLCRAAAKVTIVDPPEIWRSECSKARHLLQLHAEC